MSPALTRRALLSGVAALTCPAMANTPPFDAGNVEADAMKGGPRLTALPMHQVRLLPSPWQQAQTVNAAYLMRLEPDRLLHHYRSQAGLAPKGAAYGGWESDTIAGHTLGHYLSALSLHHAQTGDAAFRARVAYITAELALCQARDPSGYIGGFTSRQQNKILPGKIVFEQIRLGQIHSTGFDLNGAWSPLYNWHKLFAGLLDAELHCADPRARGLMTRLGTYIEGVFNPLSDAQIQQVLACEYGGLNESFAELHARSGDPRWLRLARLLQDRRTLSPLIEGQDNLANLHANTQIPKVIGLERLYEISGAAGDAVASETFWHAVTQRYSYVIGGNGDREYFPPPDTISRHITEQTCETCASYNMLKLTRQLYARQQDNTFFDYYERTQLNHIRAQQHPGTGMFCYMTPLMSGAKRDYSTPFDDFWCCVGTGMESHAKHGDSIYWQENERALRVMLYIPSRVFWSAGGITLRLDTRYPDDGHIRLVIEQAPSQARTLSFRIPHWSHLEAVLLNGEAFDVQAAAGMLRIERIWQPEDVLSFTLALPLRSETTPDSKSVIALLHGPTVLAADLAPAAAAWDEMAPVLVGTSILDALIPDPTMPGSWKTSHIGRPQDLVLRPFHALHDRRAAVYFPVFTEAEWRQKSVLYAEQEKRRHLIASHAIDVVHPGEMQSERDHAVTSAFSFPVIYRGRNGRDARSGGWFSCQMGCGSHDPLLLQTTYWGGERRRHFSVLVDGIEIARERLENDAPDSFFNRRYPVPLALTRDKRRITVTFRPELDFSAGPVFGLALLAAANLPPLTNPSQEIAWP
ncbi:glycoside hydrolase family 127 protein [Asaia siamensis]|uniref:Glycoside hydrolase family 127 protein n=1 Tax=Asaia siamensis TaxID=110479 RepID=A0ABQ1M0S8_9PROT|nr:glycoside hydrolase family 127 protein [Asaia siamensis]GBR10206.1 hypothetical protein AA0323_2738 [Asaia siamensis NRIC 0323]GGC32910.1 hypothetical protein GCM10007207_18010 [Asaia siamensis]